MTPSDFQFHAGYSRIPGPAILEQLENPEWRNGYVETRVGSRIASLFRILREQRGWSQTYMGKLVGKPQPNISKFEDPDYGKYTLTTLFEFAAAYGLPLYIDMPEWEDWFRLMSDQSENNLQRKSFDKTRILESRSRELARSAHSYRYVSKYWNQLHQHLVGASPDEDSSGNSVSQNVAYGITISISQGPSGFCVGTAQTDQAIEINPSNDGVRSMPVPQRAAVGA